MEFLAWDALLFLILLLSDKKVLPLEINGIWEDNRRVPQSVHPPYELSLIHISYGSYASRLDLVLPREINISCLLHELTGGFGKKEIQKEQTAMSGMSRVIDVEEILKMARYLGKGRAVIEIKDEQCPWNQDVFRVEFDGRATSVSRTGECPDAVMGIGIFSALILGVYQFEQIRFLPQVVIYGNEENLRKIFYQKACWIEEGF